MPSDPNFYVAIVALLVAAYAAVLQRKQYQLMIAAQARRRSGAPISPWWRYPPLIATALLAVLAWGPWLYGQLNRPAAPIGVASWGSSDPSLGLRIVAAIPKDDPSIKLIGVAFHYDGASDIHDVASLQKSAPYDARAGATIILIKPDEQFISNFRDRNMRGTNYVLLSVPTPQASANFSTIRNAVALGAKILWAGNGPP